MFEKLPNNPNPALFISTSTGVPLKSSNISLAMFNLLKSFTKIFTTELYFFEFYFLQIQAFFVNIN